MARVLQLRKGTTQENNIFIGAEAELTYNTEKKGLVIRDGLTRGGFQVPVVVEQVLPTADNDYSWYRLYSDGWIEQGGRVTNNQTGQIQINLHKQMSNEYYYRNVFADGNTSNPKPVLFVSSSTQVITVYADASNARIYWEAKGMTQA